MVLDRNELTSGSTFHSAGLVGQLRSDPTLTAMNRYSVELYRELQAGDSPPGWVECGGLRLASSEERMEELRRQAGWAKTFGLPMELVSAEEAKEMFPLISTEGVLGAAWLPTDGYLDPGHPLQRAIDDVVAELCGAPVAIGTDGCGAPAHVVSLESLARAFRAIATGGAGPAGTAVFEAMSRHPHMVGGDGRDVTRIVSSLPGFFAKDGAEAVYAGASSDGRAVAVKISDGGGRARVTVFLAAIPVLWGW